MYSFKDFLIEKTTEAKEIPFEHHPHVGWWKDKAEKDGYHTVYHGTHKRNLPHILKHGITHKDPRTGMISVTHDPHTAHGYAAMSGSGGEAKSPNDSWIANFDSTPTNTPAPFTSHDPILLVGQNTSHFEHNSTDDFFQTFVANKPSDVRARSCCDRVK